MSDSSDKEERTEKVGQNDDSEEAMTE